MTGTGTRARSLAALIALATALVVVADVRAGSAGDGPGQGNGRDKQEQSQPPGQDKKDEKRDAAEAPASAPAGSAPPSGPYKPTSDGDDQEKDPPRGDHKHTICHATGSSSNPYVVITPSVSGVYHAHIVHQHHEDIIPPFVYKGTTYSQNWNGTGQTIHANGCRPTTPPDPLDPPDPLNPPDPPKDPPKTPDQPDPPLPPDACPNIPGNQTTVPLGLVKDASGNCVVVPGAPVVDLEVVKTDAPDPVSVGGRIVYTIRVTNRGPGAATNVVATDPLPGLVGFVSVSSTQGSCNAATPVRCQLGRIENGASATITIVVSANAAGLAVNSASAAGSEGDPNPANNVSVATTRILAPLRPPAIRCDGLTVSARSLSVGRTTTVRVRTTARGRAISVRVIVRGRSISMSRLTSGAGVATFRIRPRSTGIVRFYVQGTSCQRRVGAIGVFQPPVTG